ncbi:hypothetical protein HDU88_002336 [Geranomyces variabilis]|nr:hypothetical protein HDU88_002336 [Geranomyces variabilis]
MLAIGAVFALSFLSIAPDAFSLISTAPESSSSFRQRALIEQNSFCHLLSQISIPEHVEVEVEFEGGPRQPIFVYKQGDAVSDSVIQSKAWETDATRQALWGLKLAERLRGKQRAGFIDVGANIGWWSLVVANHGHKVTAFEPSPRNQVMAVRHSACMMDPALGKNLELYSLGLGAAPDTCELLNHIGNTGNAMLRCKSTILPGDTRVFGSPEPLAVGPARFGYQATVNVQTLDNVLGRNGDNKVGTFGVMKLDVEGFEPAVLLGGEHEFFAGGNGPRMVTMEYNKLMLTGQSAKPDPGHVLRLWSKYGYLISVHGFMPGFLEPEKLDEWAAATAF